MAKAASDRLALKLMSGRSYREAVDLVDETIVAATMEMRVLRGRLAPAGRA